MSSTKPRLNQRKRRARTKIDLAALAHKNAYTINEFCERNGICRATLENYLRAGIGPLVTQAAGPGGLRLITREAEVAWHQRIAAQPLPPRGRPPQAESKGAAGAS
jgi:hypothetical protein